MVRAVRQIYRPPIPTNATRSARLAASVDRRDAPPLGVRRVFVQVAHNLYGTKDVQDTVTASYVWMADQIGHITLGLVPTLLFCWLVTAFALSRVHQLAFFLLSGVLIFSYWAYKERTDYSDTTARAKGVFP